MPEVKSDVGGRRALLGGRNLAVRAAAALCRVAGYLLLQAGSTSVAAVLLVLGYCVLLPVAIAL
jgi:hypothetical protein